MDLSIEDFSKLLDDAVNGSESAAQALLEQYGKYLRPVVRRWLHDCMRSQFDTGDFEQDVWTSFFRQSAGSDLFANPQALIGYLRTLARNKVIDATRRNLQCQKRDRNRERAIETIDKNSPDLRDRKQYTPSRLLMSEEEWEFVIMRQRPAYQEILIRIREGQDVHTVTEDLGVSEKTVRRAIKRALDLLI